MNPSPNPPWFSSGFDPFAFLPIADLILFIHSPTRGGHLDGCLSVGGEQIEMFSSIWILEFQLD